MPGKGGARTQRGNSFVYKCFFFIVIWHQMVPVYIYSKHLFEQALETAIKVNQCSKVFCTALPSLFESAVSYFKEMLNLNLT
jgi:hypothetical protein